MGLCDRDAVVLLSIEDAIDNAGELCGSALSCSASAML